MTSYERLSGLDASFLGFETPNAPMHVAVTALCEPGPLTGPGGGVDIDRVRTHVAGHLEARMPNSCAMNSIAGPGG